MSIHFPGDPIIVLQGVDQISSVRLSCVADAVRNIVWEHYVFVPVPRISICQLSTRGITFRLLHTGACCGGWLSCLGCNSGVCTQVIGS